MDKFNLLTKPWIRCIRLDGTETELGLRDVLVDSQNLREIVDTSPLVIVGLHRLLLAILHRNFGPVNFNAWKELWKQEKWNQRFLDGYFDEWQSRFNLFDEDRPFYQYQSIQKANQKEADVVSVAILMQECSSGNNATLFDHSFDAKPKSYPTSMVARYLVARQAFSIGFGKSHPFYFKDSPVIRGLTILNFGKNLFETLSLNLVVYNENKPIPMIDDEDGSDMPFWERPVADEASDVDKDGTVPRGYLDYLTWQSRRIRLFPENDGATVSECQIQQNFSIVKNVLDPFKTYVPGDNDGWRPLGISTERSVWRDSHALIQKTNSDAKQAGAINLLSQVWRASRSGEIEANTRYPIVVIGLSTEVGKTANVLSWTYDRLPIPLSFLDDEELQSLLRMALDFSEAIGSALRYGVKTLADELETGRESFSTEANFWSRMEMRFHRLLGDLPEKREAEMVSWFRDTQRTAKDALRDTVNGLSGSAAENKAGVAAENALHSAIGKAIKGKANEWAPYLPERFEAKGGNQ